MFSQNSISKALQDSILKVMETTAVDEALVGKQVNIDKNKNNKIDPEDFRILKGQKAATVKEATKVTVHNDEAEDTTLIKKMINKEKKVDEATAQKMGHAGKVTMKHVMNSSASPKVKAAIKKAAPDIKTYGDRAAALDAAGIKREEVEFEESVESNDTHFAKQSKKMQDAINLHLRKGKSYKEAVAASKVHVKEEVEELDELSRSTLGSYAKKATRDATITRKIAADFEHQGKRAKSPGMKAASDMLSQRYKIKSFKRRDGVDSAVNRLVKEDTEQFDETVLVHATYEIKESYTFGEYLTAAKYLVGDDEAIELANEAFKVQDTGIFAEELSSMDIMSRINSHRKAGHTVTEPKYSTKAGKPYHEYVVTDKETGTRRKYIHHGDVSKVENMGAKPKKDEQ